jgi:hypothetical protein
MRYSVLTCSCLVALAGCATSSPALSYEDLSEIADQRWVMEDIKGLDKAIQTHLDKEGLDMLDFHKEEITVGLNISPKYGGVTLSVGICNGVGANFRSEGRFLHHVQTKIHPAGCGVSIQKDGRTVTSYAPLAIEQHYMKIAPHIRHVFLLRDRETLYFKDENLEQLASFKRWNNPE